MINLLTHLSYLQKHNIKYYLLSVVLIMFTTTLCILSIPYLKFYASLGLLVINFTISLEVLFITEK